MSFSIPITNNSLDDLPDNTKTIEELASKAAIETVLPRFINTPAGGRFVSFFFTFSGENGTTVTLYVRRRTDDGQSSFEKQANHTLDTPPAIRGSLWEQTIVIERDDVIPIEHLRQRAQYTSIWLHTGSDPDVAFEEYRHNPFPTELSGLPDCPHQNVDRGIKTPNLDILVAKCSTCECPLAVATEQQATNQEYTPAHEALTAQFIDLPVEEDAPAKGTMTYPKGTLTHTEISLHVLSRYAHVEQSHLEIYARNNRIGYLVTIGSMIIGYALWERIDDLALLQQVYVFPEFRGSGFGQLIVRAWFDELVDERYYAIGANEAGMTTLEQEGHIEDGIAIPATILSCRDTSDPAQINANYADRLRSNNT